MDGDVILADPQFLVRSQAKLESVEDYPKLALLRPESKPILTTITRRNKPDSTTLSFQLIQRLERTNVTFKMTRDATSLKRVSLEAFSCKALRYLHNPRSVE